MTEKYFFARWWPVTEIRQAKILRFFFFKKLKFRITVKIFETFPTRLILRYFILTIKSFKTNKIFMHQPGETCSASERQDCWSSKVPVGDSVGSFYRKWYSFDCFSSTFLDWSDRRSCQVRSVPFWQRWHRWLGCSVCYQSPWTSCYRNRCWPCCCCPFVARWEVAAWAASRKDSFDGRDRHPPSSGQWSSCSGRRCYPVDPYHASPSYRTRLRAGLACPLRSVCLSGGSSKRGEEVAAAAATPFRQPVAL